MNGKIYYAYIIIFSQRLHAVVIINAHTHTILNKYPSAQVT